MMPREKGETERRLSTFIVDELIEESFHGTLHGDDPLAAGAVDSLGIEQLIEYIYEAFGVELEDEEIVYDHFESVTTLAALVDLKR